MPTEERKFTRRANSRHMMLTDYDSRGERGKQHKRGSKLDMIKNQKRQEKSGLGEEKTVITQLER